jgi:hypothetical protein
MRISRHRKTHWINAPARSLSFAAIALAAGLLVATNLYAEQPKPAGAAPESVEFEMHRVGAFRSEACGVGDFNNDGKLDIVAGPFVYLAPDWTVKKIRKLEGKVDDQGKGYYWDFMNAPLDVDGDGRLDVVSCSWHGKRSEWYRNTGLDGGLWPRATIEKNGVFEHGGLWDIDGDGQRNEILPAVAETIWYERGVGDDSGPSILKHVISKKRMNWGAGVGDVNGDGRPDVLRPDAWFEAPADPRNGKWKEHPLRLGHLTEDKADHTPQIWVCDVNADGLNDIVTSSAHKHGIFWYEQIRGDGDTDVTWKQHVIDASWTQAHSLVMADVDGDGDLDLVTGKRFMAHSGNDPGAFEPLGVYWYELRPGSSPPWVKHVISYKQRVGAGMNIPIVDLDNDGDLDIVVTGKFGGPVWFENKSKTSERNTPKLKK